jgi:hypothetical protein
MDEYKDYKEPYGTVMMDEDDDNDYPSLMQYMDEGNYKFFRQIKPLKSKKKIAVLEIEVHEEGKKLYEDYKKYLADLKKLDW